MKFTKRELRARSLGIEEFNLHPNDVDKLVALWNAIHAAEEELVAEIDATVGYDMTKYRELRDAVEQVASQRAAER